MKKVAKKFGGNKKSRTFALPFEKRGSEKDLRREIESGISSLEMLEMLEVEMVYNDYPTKSGSKKNFEKFFKKNLENQKKVVPLQPQSKTTLIGKQTRVH